MWAKNVFTKTKIPRTCLGSISHIRKQSDLSHIHHIGKNPLKYISFGQILEDAANRWPDRPAIISRHEKKTLTYSQLLEETDKLAASLQAIGMKKGDRLGVWLPNCSQWIALTMAASRIGVISVSINHMYRQKEIKYALQKVGIKTVVAPGKMFDPTHYRVLCEIIPELAKSQPGDLISKEFKELKNVILVNDDQSSGTYNYEDLVKMSSASKAGLISSTAKLLNPDSACNIQFTSGTTGKPKAAILSHFNLVNNGNCVGRRNEFDIGHKKICVQVPLFHVFGVVVGISSSIQHGATMVLPSAVYNKDANVGALIEENCEVIYGTPTMHVDLVNEIKSRGITNLKSEIAVTGGATITPKLVETMAKTLNLKKIKSIYGMTEVTSVNFQSLPDEDSQRSLHFIGHLHDHLEAKVVGENNELVPFGQPGELMTRGYSTMIGYWDNEDKTKETIDSDKWIKTGDQFVLHADGYGQIVGRLKDIIIRGGENISPKEIEDALASHPDVIESQVFGVSDERLGEEICATVRIKGKSFDADSLRKHVAGQLARFKVPRLIKQVEEFPKTASGKIQKFKLKEMVESGKL